MARTTAKRWRRWTLGSAIVALALFGVSLTIRAMWVLAHGGNKAFGGAFDYPRWSAVHFVPALVFVAILPFQLWSHLREVYPRVHRIAGRVAAICGAAFSLTGLALPFAMPARPFGERAFMTTMGSLFGLLLWKGIAAARRGDIAAHRRWMVRVTAAALSPLTERIIFPFLAAAGIDSMSRFWDLFVTALWLSTLVNLVIAEWWIQGTAAPGFSARRVARERLAS